MMETTEHLEIADKAINQTRENVHQQNPYYLLWPLKIMWKRLSTV